MEDKNFYMQNRLPGQRKFNERFLPKTNVSALPDIAKGQWMSNEVVTKLPGMRRDFDQSRDPYRTQKMQDFQQNQSRGHGEQTGRGSDMIRQEQPKAILRPPEEIRATADQQRFNARWQAEKRAAELSQHNQNKTMNDEQPSIVNRHRSPQR